MIVDGSQRPLYTSGSGTTMKRRRWLFILTLCLVVLLIGVWWALQAGERSLKPIGKTEFVTSRDGTRIAFTKLGSGPPLILVDGAFCYRGNGPAPELAPVLAKDFTVYAYDRRGRGESGNSGEYAVEREIEDLQAVAGVAGDVPFVVGISSGAALALQAAASGVRMRKLALYEPPYLDSSDRQEHLETVKAQLNNLIQANDRYGAVKYFMTDVFGAPKAFVLVMPLVMRGSWQRNELVAHTLPYDLTILEDDSVLTSRSAQIILPVLVVGGDQSPQPLRDAVARVAKALPHATSRFLPGQTHMLSAAAFAPVVTEFFLQ